MRKLFSTKYNAGAYSTALLILRLGFGILMAHHGYGKLTHYNEMQSQFMSFMGLSPSITLGLVIFAEFFCALLVTMGLFTRLACIPLIISTGYTLSQVHQWDVFGKGELAILYLIAFVTLLFTGPGKVSVDNMISK
jgi:putative oxidoreductase